MAVYEYACDECGDFLAQYPMGEAEPEVECAGCGEMRPRRYSMAPTQIMHEHWNMSAQAPISSRRQYDAMLREQSDKASERLGLEHNFQSIDIHDPAFDPVE